MLQWNRVTSLGYLISSKPGTGSRPRRASFSHAISGLRSLPSCPALSTTAYAEREVHISKRARVISAPFIRRNGDLGGYGEARSRHLQYPSKLPPLQVSIFGQSLSATPFQSFTQGEDDIEDIASELSSLSIQVTEDSMPKAPPFSFRSPASRTKMHQFSSALYTPLAKPPQVTYLATPGNWNPPWPLSSSQVSSIAAFLQPHRRSPSPESRTSLRLVCSTEDEHILSVHLPGFAPEMVTICAHREDKLAVTADLWHAETNCHHEWLVSFSSRDANVLQTRARFSADGTLTIHVPRRKAYVSRMRGRLR